MKIMKLINIHIDLNKITYAVITNLSIISFFKKLQYSTTSTLQINKVVNKSILNFKHMQFVSGIT